jgi:hypothetical protein
MSRHGSCAEFTIAAKLRSIPKHLVGTGDEDFHLEVARRPKRHVLLVGMPHRLRLTNCGLQENKMPLCVIFSLKLVSNESWWQSFVPSLILYLHKKMKIQTRRKVKT